MEGLIKKRHFFLVWKYFGFKKAIKLLFSRKKTALEVLMGG